jgi:hypothetical protein
MNKWLTNFYNLPNININTDKKKQYNNS